MSTCLDRMRQLMRSTGLYSLASDGLMEAELLSYAAVFDELEQKMKAIAQEAIPITASGEGLLAYEQLLGQDRRDQPTQKRRDMIIYALSTQPRDFDMAGMVRALRSLGIETQITEDKPGESLTVKVTGFSGSVHDYDKLRQDARAILPAHLETIFEMSSFTWNEFDAKDLTWNDFEANADTWDEFEINGSDLSKP